MTALSETPSEAPLIPVVQRRHIDTLDEVVARPLFGTAEQFYLPLPSLPSGSGVSLPVMVVTGARPGPTVWISAAIHGDEIIGTEIIRQLLGRLDPAAMAGMLLAVPVVDVYGFNRESRYLPERRDLNRSFPGTPTGSLAARLAHVFSTEIVSRCSAGIDLHTGSGGRSNVAQVRGDLTDPAFMELAGIFDARVTVGSDTIVGSLRKHCVDAGILYLIYEAGEAERFDQHGVAVGLDGCLRVLGHLGLVEHPATSDRNDEHFVGTDAGWVRADHSGVFVPTIELGNVVVAGQELGDVGDTFGGSRRRVRAPVAGMVIGLAVHPLVEAGDALVHLATPLTPPLASPGE